jgi:hypothetical protein
MLSVIKRKARELSKQKKEAEKNIEELLNSCQDNNKK